MPLTDDQKLELCNKLIDVFKNAGDISPDDMRLVSGLLLSSIHSSILFTARERPEQATLSCIDTIKRLMESLKNTIDELKIEGVTLDIGYDIPDRKEIQ